jgi:hypothetical protein
MRKKTVRRPTRKNDLGHDIGEMKLIVTKCHPRWIDFKKFDKPSQLEG